MSSLVILICLIMFTTSIVVLVWAKNKIASFEQQIKKQLKTNHLSDEITALNAGSIGMGGRFLKVEKDLQALNSRFNEIEAQMQSKSPYGQGIIMAQRGSSAEDIMEICGISYNEAALLIMMHRQGRAA